MKKYILDACAVIAYLNDEKGADVVRDLFIRARDREISLYMNAANLIEVYYDQIRELGSKDTDEIIRQIYNDFPISIIEANTPDIVREAAYFKAAGKMSFADSILVATAKCTGAAVVTSDHDELAPIEQKENIPFYWIRPSH